MGDLRAVLLALVTLYGQIDTLWRYRRYLLQQLRSYVNLHLLPDDETQDFSDAAVTLLSEQQTAFAKSFGLLRDRVGAIELSVSPPPIDHFVPLPSDVIVMKPSSQVEPAREWFAGEVQSFEQRAEACSVALLDARRRFYAATTPLTALEALSPIDRESLEHLRLQVSSKLSGVSIELHKSAA